ncbi:multicopper oxidase domain-containing protein [Antrihabitans stalactiti]|uniref:Copper oxidase n=1 Tax=Antrihabitans stalactiti TaxID=2584121 RepID=A0A848K924_9NOCA|nr:copper oxidase [Antrihabitans stalactiti]
MDESKPPRRIWLRIMVGILATALVVIGGLVGYTSYAWITARTDTVGKVNFTHALRIPPLAPSTVDPSGTRVFDLDLRSGTTDLGHGPNSETWGVNGSYLGPTVRVRRGEAVRMNVHNSLGETSTLHWHGMHLPAAMDGGPHQMVEPGATWSPQWMVNQPAATLWYHPHLHGATAEHVYRGIAGMFLIDDDSTRDLPDRYGIDDIPVIVQDKKFDGDQLDARSGIFADTGVLGDEILVNGTPGPYVDVTTQRVRLRLLNASNARVYNFGFSDGLGFTLVGTDGGLISKPVDLQNIQLSPGERAEIVVAVPSGTNPVLRSAPAQLGADFFNGRFAGAADSFDVLQLRAAAELEQSAPVPMSLAAPHDLGAPTVTRKFDLTSSTTINNRSMDMSRIDEVVTVGTTEVWEIANISGGVHNFHVHDVQFRVLDTDDPSLSGPKDTVYLPPGVTRRLLMRFTDFSDPTSPYMFHCHLLRHEDNGLMGQFVVVKPGETAVAPMHSHAGNH